MAAVDGVAESAVAAEAEEGIPVEFEVVAVGRPASVVVETMDGVVVGETMGVVVVWKVPAEAVEFGPGVPWLVVFCASLGIAFVLHVL